jgi:hypothetical protein
VSFFTASPRYAAQEPYDSDIAEREAILSRTSIDPYETSNAVSPVQDPAAHMFPVTEETPPTARPVSSANAASRGSRGVSLYDPGPGKSASISAVV